MPDVTKANRGARFDEFPEQAQSDRHGAQFDRFTRQASHGHNGSYFDSNFGNKTGDEFERALAGIPEGIRRLAAACPGCGHHHDLEAALRAGHNPPANKAANDEIVDVHKQHRDDTTTPGADDLHQALVDSIRKTYGSDRAWTR